MAKAINDRDPKPAPEALANLPRLARERPGRDGQDNERDDIARLAVGDLVKVGEIFRDAALELRQTDRPVSRPCRPAAASKIPRSMAFAASRKANRR
jgi:hypothetical protein